MKSEMTDLCLLKFGIGGELMSAELKPCPFCGGEATVKVGELCNADGVVVYRHFEVHCLACGVDTPYFNTRDEAIKAWNMRVKTERIIRCKDCAYFDPAHIEKDGQRFEYAEMPEEAFGFSGIHVGVTAKYGVNVGSRCIYDAQNTLFRHENDFCSRAKKSVEEMRPQQPEQKRTFLGIDVSYPKISTYPEYEGKPYYAIKYLEDGEIIVGFGTYKPYVLSEYLRKYFIPSAR